MYNIYKKQALKLAEGIDLPEDHLAFMREFMATLADRAVEARAASDMTALHENLLLSQAFLKHHILNWYPEFSALAARLVDERFYRGLLEAAGAFFALDAKVLRDLVKDEKASYRCSILPAGNWPMPSLPTKRASIRSSIVIVACA